MNEQSDRKCVALVTGGSGGIGRATCQLLAARRLRVFGTSRQRRPDEDGTEMLQLDVRSEQSAEACVEEVLRRAGRLDILVNNAGIEYLGIAEETPVDDVRAVFETNFFGAVRLINLVLPQMRERRSGRIVNVGSLAAQIGEPGESVYAASKSALAAYSEAIRHELWPLGIYVSLVEPGAFRTDIVRDAAQAPSRISDYDQVRAAAERTLGKAAQSGADPRFAAQVIVKAATAANPRRRYAAGSEAIWLPYLKQLLPQRLFDAALRWGFGLSKLKGSE